MKIIILSIAHSICVEFIEIYVTNIYILYKLSPINYNYIERKFSLIYHIIIGDNIYTEHKRSWGNYYLTAFTIYR